MLIDTHVLLSVLTDDGRIGPETRSAMGEGSVFVSPVSLWEVAVKVAAGKLPYRGSLTEDWAVSGFVSLPLLADHGLRIGEVGELRTNDPFDRMLLTQAMVEGLEFYTWDRAILAANLPFVRDARV